MPVRPHAGAGVNHGPITRGPRAALAGLLAAALLLSPLARAGGWSATELQLLRGSGYHQPGPPAGVGQTIFTLNHARGLPAGRLFAFVDHSRADSAGGVEWYGEAYASIGSARWFGRGLGAGAVRDVNLTLGLNYGDGDSGANPRVLLPGLTVDLALPGFDFFSVDLLAYVDRGRFKGEANACNGETWQVTPAWKLPIRAGGLTLSFEGFMDVIGPHGGCARQLLAQPQLRLDLGGLFDHPGALWAGIEYQYWRNKYGVRGLKESLPQLLVAWAW